VAYAATLRRVTLVAELLELLHEAVLVAGGAASPGEVVGDGTRAGELIQRALETATELGMGLESERLRRLAASAGCSSSR
jgi:hypothetical protein